MRNIFAIFADELHPLRFWAVARLTMLAWSQVDGELASYRNQPCSNESTNFFYTHEFLLEWCGACDLRPPFCPSHDFLQCDRCQTCSCGTSRHGWTGRGYPRNYSSCIFSWANSRRSTRDPLASSHNGARGVALSWCSRVNLTNLFFSSLLFSSRLVSSLLFSSLLFSSLLFSSLLFSWGGLCGVWHAGKPCV